MKRGILNMEIMEKIKKLFKKAFNIIQKHGFKEYGKTPSKKDLIETRPSLRKKFQKAVEELLAE